MAEKKIIIGIDPGVGGGIAIINEEHQVITKIVMPVIGKSKKAYDINEIAKFLEQYKNNSIAIIEKQQPQFRDGKKQSFKTGYGYGVLQATLTTLQIPFTIVAPKTWQKKVFEGIPNEDTKTSSIMFCKRKWPKENWLATERSKKCHDGLTDAACIAYHQTQK